MAFGESRKSVVDVARFAKYLTNDNVVRLMCFVANVLFLLSNFQRKLQNDSLTIVDTEPEL